MKHCVSCASAVRTQSLPSFKMLTSKMKALVTNKRYLIWLCLHPPKESASFLNVLCYFLFTTSVLAIICIGLIVSLVYFYRILTTDMDFTLLPIFQISADANMAYAVTVSFFSRHKMAGIISTLDTIYEQSK